MGRASLFHSPCEQYLIIPHYCLVRWGAFWYVGLGGRGRGMVLRLNNAARRAELVALGAAVNIPTVWRGDLMIGTRNGLYTLAKAR